MKFTYFGKVLGLASLAIFIAAPPVFSLEIGNSLATADRSEVVMGLMRAGAQEYTFKDARMFSHKTAGGPLTTLLLKASRGRITSQTLHIQLVDVTPHKLGVLSDTCVVFLEGDFGSSEAVLRPPAEAFSKFVTNGSSSMTRKATKIQKFGNVWLGLTSTGNRDVRLSVSQSRSEVEKQLRALIVTD